jgi:glycosyltransferase involved in cell wall biosynthesis
MSRRELVNKGISTLKRQGAKEFTKKAIHYGKYKAAKKVIKFAPSFGRKHFAIQDDEYNFISNPIFQIDGADIAASRDATNGLAPSDIRTANWFVPYFDHITFGGIYTIFRFIDYMSRQGVHSRIIIFDNPLVNTEDIKHQISNHFPALESSEVIIYEQNRMPINELPESDIAVCTIWMSAYFLLKFNKTKRKYYFIQDYEPLFYPGGATYALAESTYRFGFEGIVNTPGLLAAVEQRHGLKGVSFVPAVDRTVYYPPSTSRTNERVRIFFYARPNNPRNAFNLGISIIKQLLQKYGNKVEIVTAGAEWNEQKYGLGGLITNLGLLKDLQAVAELYRSCDIGFVYMLSKHPSYQPFEFMASGMATVSNNNEDNLWFLKDEENCLLAEPSPKAMSEQISRLIDDEKLRKKIANAGHATISNNWVEEQSKVWQYIAGRQH